MRNLRKRREELQISQTELALRCGVSRQHLNRLEQGKALASREQASALRKMLGVEVLTVDDVLGDGEVRNLTGAAPYDLEMVNPVPWKAALRYWGQPLRQLGLEMDNWDWMATFLPADSARECYGLGQLSARGARRLLGNPNLWGFSAHVVVDRLGRLLGDRLLPALIYRDAKRTFVFWPQVSLRTEQGTFRLDGLMFYRNASGRYWMAVEFDGRGHDPTGDEFRLGQLVMLEVRISGEEIGQLRTLQLLLERAEAQAAKAQVRAASVSPHR